MVTSSCSKKPRYGRKDTNRTKASKRSTLYDKLNEALLAAIEKGTDPWRKEWKDIPANKMLPFNPVTKHIYTGKNALFLMLGDREDARWLTFNQAKSKGWNVRGGEHGTPVYYFARHYKKKEDENISKTTRDQEGKERNNTTTAGDTEKEQEDKEASSYLVARSYTVFNAGQIDGIPPRTDLEEYLIPPESMWHPCSLAERFIAATGADIKIGPKNKNFYRYGVDEDAIYIADPRQFERPEGYYSTILHELAHWTGHPDRMGRIDPLHPSAKGDERYAKEELVADIASLYFMTELCIPPTLHNTASYVAAWAKKTEQDESGKYTNVITKAMQDAAKAVSFAFKLAFERDPELKDDLAKARRIWLFGDQRKKMLEIRADGNEQVKEETPSVNWYDTQWRVEQLSDGALFVPTELVDRIGLTDKLSINTRTGSDGFFLYDEDVELFYKTASRLMLQYEVVEENRDISNTFSYDYEHECKRVLEDMTRIVQDPTSELEQMSMLVRFGADLNKTNDKSPLSITAWAIREASISQTPESRALLEIVLSDGGNPNTPIGSKGLNGIEYARDNGAEDVVQLIERFSRQTENRNEEAVDTQNDFLEFSI